VKKDFPVSHSEKICGVIVNIRHFVPLKYFVKSTVYETAPCVIYSTPLLLLSKIQKFSLPFYVQIPSICVPRVVQETKNTKRMAA
jgi:hypothetical protein